MPREMLDRNVANEHDRRERSLDVPNPGCCWEVIEERAGWAEGEDGDAGFLEGFR